MSDLTPEDRALLDLARGGHDPAAADCDRVRAAVAAELGVAVGLVSSSAGGAVGGASVAGGALSGAGLFAAKILGAMALVVSAGAGGVAIHRALRVASPAAPSPPAYALPPVAVPRTPMLAPDLSGVTLALGAPHAAEPATPSARPQPIANADRTPESAKKAPAPTSWFVPIHNPNLRRSRRLPCRTP